MRRIVLLSGVFNITLACVVLSTLHLIPSAAREAVGVRTTGLFWTLLLCGILWLTGLILVVSARDLITRGVIVYYEGLARLTAAGLLLTFGIFELGSLAVLIGIGDLGFGLLQVFGVPRCLGRTHTQMILDQRAGTRT